MPYTLSHPAFAVPLRRLGIPAAALAIGSLTPDVPLWADAVGVGAALEAVGVTYGFTHSPMGVLALCPLLGLGLWAWWMVLRAPLYDALPASWRGGNPWTASPARRRAGESRVKAGVWPLQSAVAAVAGLWIGAASHALVDELTHEGRWAHSTIGWFAQDHAGLAGVKWAQYVGSIGGAMIVAGYVLFWLRHRRRSVGGGAGGAMIGRDGPAGDSGRRLMRVGIVAGVVVAVVVSTLIAASESPSYAVFQAATTGVLIVAAGATAGAVAWWTMVRRRRRIGSSAPAP